MLAAKLSLDCLALANVSSFGPSVEPLTTLVPMLMFTPSMDFALLVLRGYTYYEARGFFWSLIDAEAVQAAATTEDARAVQQGTMAAVTAELAWVHEIVNVPLSELCNAVRSFHNTSGMKKLAESFEVVPPQTLERYSADRCATKAKDAVEYVEDLIGELGKHCEGRCDGAISMREIAKKCTALSVARAMGMLLTALLEHTPVVHDPRHFLLKRLFKEADGSTTHLCIVPAANGRSLPTVTLAPLQGAVFEEVDGSTTHVCIVPAADGRSSDPHPS